MTTTEMTTDLALKLKAWVEAQDPKVRLDYTDEGKTALIVQQRQPEVNSRGQKTGRKAWVEIERHANALALAHEKGLT